MDWRSLALTRPNPIPLYYQLAEVIRERVRSGDLAPGDRLPPDRELGDYAGVSRMTARQAVAYLVREGTLTVKQGVGTFVAEPKLTYDPLRLLGFTEETVRQGGIASSRVLEQAVVEPPPAITAALALRAGDRTLRLVRLRSAGDVPLLLETGHLPSSLCPGLEDEDLGARSLYALLELKFGVRVRRARQTVEAAVANRYEGDLLGVDGGAPLLLVEGVSYAEGDRPVEHFRAVYRGYRVKLALESGREPGRHDGAGGERLSLVVT